MLAVVKKPRTKSPDLEIRGKIPQWMIVRLKKEYGKSFKLTNDISEKDDLVDIRDTNWYKKMKKKWKPGDSIKIYRTNFGYSQEKLGKLLEGIPRQNISAMENGKLAINKHVALQLSKIFKVPIDRFIFCA
ncbi:MAG: helix-turn-helix domain-containing protein [Candidatus Anammoxibacter sp.]